MAENLDVTTSNGFKQLILKNLKSAGKGAAIAGGTAVAALIAVIGGPIARYYSGAHYLDGAAYFNRTIEDEQFRAELVQEHLRAYRQNPGLIRHMQYLFDNIRPKFGRYYRRGPGY